MTDTSMINMQDVRCAFDTFTLDIDSFTLPEDTITGLVGTNGSGKTTMFRLLGGLLKADAGTVSLFDQNAWNMPVSVKEQIGVVFADSGFSPEMTPEDISKILAAFFPHFDRAQFDSLCQKFSIPTRQRLSTFSNGMLAKAKIISAISHHPRLLLLDEPTSGLDVAARQDIHTLLQDFMSTPGRSILISSHIASDLEQLCDDFWMIHNGKITMHETVDDLQNRYGVLLVDDRQLASLDPTAIIAKEKTAGGWKVLVSDRAYYEENYPGLRTEKGNIDDLILITERNVLK